MPPRVTGRSLSPIGKEIAGCPGLNVEVSAGPKLGNHDAGSGRPATGEDMRMTYNQPHRFYCGVDLHARTLFTHVLDAKGKTVLPLWSRTWVNMLLACRSTPT